MPAAIFADTNLDLYKCSNDKDNFSRLACFDKLVDSLQGEKVTIQATSKAVANASIKGIAKNLGDLERVRFNEAIGTLSYAKMDFPISIGNDALHWISSDLLKTVNNKTSNEIIILASEPEIIKLSLENRAKFKNHLDYKMSDEEALNVVIDIDIWDSYYVSKSKIKNNDEVVKKLETAFNFLKANLPDFKKVINGQKVGQIIDKSEKVKQELKDKEQELKEYLGKIKIYNLKANFSNFSEGKFPAIDFKLKNEGNRELKRVEITVYFKDKKGNNIYEQKYNPIWTTSYEKETLKPNYIWGQEKGKTYLSKSVPEEWNAGEVEAKVTKIEFKN